MEDSSKMAKWYNWPKQHPEWFWGIALFCFSADQVVNHWVDFPFFMLAIPFLLLAMVLQLKQDRKLWLFIHLVFIGLFALKIPLTRSLQLIDFTDLLQLLFCISSLFFLIEYQRFFTIRTIVVLMLVSLILFVPYFLGFNSSFGMENEVYVYREYRSGFFRIPHVASYLFGFLALVCFERYFNRWGKKWLLIGLLLVLLSVYTGVRTVAVALFLAGISAIIVEARYRWLGIGLTALLAFILVLSPMIHHHFEGTLFSPFFELINSIVYSKSPNSRELIWSVWLDQIQTFNWLDWCFGKSTSAAHQANLIALKYDIWFHNDFLHIIYAYGIFGFTCYLLFWGFVVKKLTANSNLWVKIGVLGAFYCAFFNGFYTYYALFTFLPVIVMRSERDAYSRH